LFIPDSHGNPLKDLITILFEEIPLSSVSLPSTYKVTSVAMVGSKRNPLSWAVFRFKRTFTFQA
jgi:hypothetical protein